MESKLREVGRQALASENSMRRYVNILSESGFKAVFGGERNKDVLIDILNLLLPPHRQVVDLTYLSNEHPGTTSENKSVRLDLVCMSQDSTRYIVEVQCYSQRHFFKRCVEYSAREYGYGNRAGDNTYDIPPVYLIGLMNNRAILRNRDSDYWKDHFVSKYTFREEITQDVQEETISLIFVELSRFDKKLSECHTLLDKWCYCMAKGSALMELPAELRIETFERFFRACEIANFTPSVKHEYEQDMLRDRDQENIIDTAREEGLAKGLAKGREEGLVKGREEGLAKGREEGREEGLAKGQEKERLAIARKMKAENLPVETIVSITGLTEEEVVGL